MGFAAQTSSSGPPAAEIWRREVMQIPTVFGRLVYLSSLRDAFTGRYLHPTLMRILGDEAADRALRHHHYQLFSQWIASTLEEQKTDLDEYLRSAGGDGGIRRYKSLIPPTARDVERQLYLADLETLFELIRFERSGAFGNPEAWPLQ
jgi:hypothetical protein